MIVLKRGSGVAAELVFDNKIILIKQEKRPTGKKCAHNRKNP